MVFKMLNIVGIISLISIYPAYAQQQKIWNHSIAITTENDAYLLMGKDGYYTNGLFVQVNKATEKNKYKQITRFEIGQMLYNSRDRLSIIKQIEAPDRPYCGYLFLKFSKDKFKTSNAMLGYGIEVGAIGKWSLGQQLQQWYHQQIGVANDTCWSKQIPNAIGVNLHANYSSVITLALTQYKNIKIIPVTEATIGNFFMQLKIGTNLCWGKFEKNENSNLFNAKLNTEHHTQPIKKEWYCFYTPQIITQLYNATMQGNLFKQPNNPVTVFTSLPTTFVWQQKFGMVYSVKKWQAMGAIIYQTKEAKTQQKPSIYAALQLAYQY